MNTIESLVVASIAGILAATGIKALTPEAQQITDQVVAWACIQDKYAVIKTEITGHDYTAGISSPINVEEIAAAVPDMLEQNPEVEAEASAAIIRWDNQ